MCLDRHRSHPLNRPFNRSRIRWKAAMLIDGRHLEPSEPAYLRARYKRRAVYRLDKWMKAKGQNNDWAHTGFHVLLSLGKCQSTQNDTNTSKWHANFHVIRIKVEVRGFLAAGHFDYANSETWRYMRILKIIYPKGYKGPRFEVPKRLPFNPRKAVRV